MKNLVSFLFFWLLGIGTIVGQKDLHESVVQLFKEQKVHPSSFSIHAYNTQSQQECLSYRSDEFMIPASSLKVITTFSALDILGSNFRYETQVGYSGKISKDGTLSGNIVIIGSGDPSLGSFREELGPDFNILLSKIVSAIKSKGIKCIDGHILVDSSRFQEGGTHPGWSWNDVGNYYGAGPHGLNINENEYLIHFDRNVQIDSLVKVHHTDPYVPGLSLDCRVSLAEAGTGDNAYIYGGEGFYHKIIKGTIPAGRGTFAIRGSMPDPPLFMAQEVADRLEAAGITNQGELVEAHHGDLKTILTFKSKTLRELVRLANSKSINLYCEAFLNTLVSEGSRSKALNRLKGHLDSIGLDTLSISQQDGSGLHSRNVITSRFFTQFLGHYFNSWKGDAMELLPRASHEGTVRGLLKSKKSKGRAWLKSGYIGGVLTYTGYVKNKKGQIIALSIMANNFEKRVPEIREICERIIEEVYLN